MSLEQLAKFLEDGLENEELGAALMSAEADELGDVIVRLASDAGYDIDAALADAPTELDEAMLTEVAGGTLTTTGCGYGTTNSGSSCMTLNVMSEKLYSMKLLTTTPLTPKI